MLLWKLSPGVQPGIGHCSTRYCRPAVLGLLQERHEALLELDQVLVHRLRLVAADEAGDRRDAEQRRGVHDPHHEVVLLAPDRRVLVQHVVEVADVGDRHAGGVDGGEHALGPHARRTARADRACWRPGRASPRPARRRATDAAPPTARCSRRRARPAKSSHSSTARSGSGSRRSRGRQLLQGGGQHADRHELTGRTGLVSAHRFHGPLSVVSSCRRRRPGARLRADSMAACSTRWVVEGVGEVGQRRRRARRRR